LKFTKRKTVDPLTAEQYELVENARRRMIAKKRLYQHGTAFLMGSVIFVLLNKGIQVWPNYHWYIAAISVWAFILVMHTLQVFVFHKFMGKEWERKQRENLVRKQKERIAEIQKEIETQFPISKVNKSEKS